MSRSFTGLPSAVIYGYGGAVQRTSDHAEVPPPPPPPPPMPPIVNENPIVGDPAGQIPYVHVYDSSESWSLYELNADTQFEYPASCVKLMTVLLAWEYKENSWSDSVTVVASDCGQPIGGLNLDLLGLDAGDVVTYEQLASALLLKSAGDACQVIARKVGEEIVGGEVSATDARIAFVARMNERAVELGIEGTFFDAYGGCTTASPAVTRNVLSARDLTKLCRATFANVALRDIAVVASNPIVITDGPNPRTLPNANYSPFMNGPYFNRQGERDTSVLAGKNGVWELDGLYHHNCTLIWEAPNGNEIIITTLNSKSPWGCVLDQKGLMYSILRDFPYLWDGIPTDTDPAWSNVKVLLNDDLEDDSTIGRTVTLSSVTLGDAVIATTLGGVFNSLSDAISMADAADLSVGASDMCVEEWYAGPGAAPPSDEWVFFSKFDTGQKEWAVDYYQGYFQIFVSTDGSGQFSAAVMNVDPFDRNVFFNGAPRHIAFVKNGSEWSCWLNGEKMATVLTHSAAFDGTAPLQVGLSAFSVSALGRVDEFRFTKGSSRYGNNMVTLTALPFPRAGSSPPPPPPPPP